jgi:hypothetical protein
MAVTMINSIRSAAMVPVIGREEAVDIRNSLQFWITDEPSDDTSEIYLPNPDWEELCNT